MKLKASCEIKLISMSVCVPRHAVMPTSIRFRIKLNEVEGIVRNQTDFDVSMRATARGYDHFDTLPYSTLILYHIFFEKAIEKNKKIKYFFRRGNFSFEQNENR